MASLSAQTDPSFAEAVVQENTCAGVFFNKASSLKVSLLKKDFSKEVFLLILQNFRELLFCRTSANSCFWRSCNSCN